MVVTGLVGNSVQNSKFLIHILVPTNYEPSLIVKLRFRSEVRSEVRSRSKLKDLDLPGLYTKFGLPLTTTIELFLGSK